MGKVTRLYRKRFNRMGKNTKTGKKLDRINKKVNTLIHEDPVYIVSNNGTISDGSVTAAIPTITVINALGAGDTNILRDGAKVRWKRLTMKLYCKAAAMTDERAVRIIVVREKTALGSAPTLAQLMSSATPAPFDMYNRTTRDFANRFRIIWDSGVFSIGPNISDYTSITGLNTSVPSSRCFNITKRFNFVTDYSRGDAATVADIETNSLSVIYITDNTITNGLLIAGSYILFGYDT